MREHPLLMKGPLVRATLEGRKTQTRRPIKMRPHGVEPYAPGYADGALWNYSFTEVIARCPLGRAGDRLWVRETFRVDHNLSRDGHPQVVYLAGGFSVARTAPAGTRGYPDPQDKWTPSIHMPRWACRLVLPLVSVRVERVQDITDEDAEAEGVEPIGGSYREGFRAVLTSIYGPKAWEENWWVWVAEWNHIEVRALGPITTRPARSGT